MTADGAAAVACGPMAMAPASSLASAAAFMCSAADSLRAAGLEMFAEEIESLLAILDAELLLGTSPDD